MMEIDIVVYKESGKYYSNNVVVSEVDIPLYSDDFIPFVVKNLPARVEGGFVVVRDANDDNGTFHEALYRMDELLNFKPKKYEPLGQSNSFGIPLTPYERLEACVKDLYLDAIKECKGDYPMNYSSYKSIDFDGRECLLMKCEIPYYNYRFEYSFAITDKDSLSIWGSKKLYSEFMDLLLYTTDKLGYRNVDVMYKMDDSGYYN